MPYAFTHDVPATDEIYRQIRAGLPEQAPEGLIVHLVTRGDLGLRYIDVWETKEAWHQFSDMVLVPVVERVLAGYGIPHDESLTRFEEIDLVDVWRPGVAVLAGE